MQGYGRPASAAAAYLNSGEGVAFNTRSQQHKRGPGAAEADAMSKRQAFSDVTNQHKEHYAPDKDVQSQQASCQGGYGLALPGYAVPTVACCPRPDVVDIDSEDAEDPMACTEIVNDIFAHLRRAETQRRPSTCYMESVQTDINPMMRSILVDWLVEVAQEYRLTSDTLFLSVAYIDRFLSLVDVRRNKLQLVGVTCMLVASKYEEIYAPAIDEFCYITDNTYTRDQVVSMESEILRVLEFDLTQPTIKTFLRRFIKAASGEIALDATYEFLCAYLAELTMMDYGMLHFLPSHIAASIVLVALYMLNKPTWSPTLQFYTNYMPRDLRRCAQLVHGLFVQAKTSSLPASREKYASSKFAGVSQLGTADNLPEWLFSQ